MVALIIGRGVFSARAQIFSILFFIVENYCLVKIIETGKKRYSVTIIIMAILLANIHASIFLLYFVFFIPFLMEMFLSKLKLSLFDNIEFRNNKYWKLLIITFIIAIMMGFISPLGMTPYTSIIKESSEFIRKEIEEMEPIVLIEHWHLLLFLIIPLEILMFTKSKIYFSDISMILGLFIMTLSTYRCLYYLVFIGGIFVCYSVGRLIDCYEFNLSNHRQMRYIIYILFVFITVDGIGSFLYGFSSESYVKSEEYPIDTCNYIVNNMDYDSMKIINSMGIGGYLEFRGIKAFIDSRTGLYSPEFNDGVEIIYDAVYLYHGLIDYTVVINKYKATHIIFSKKDLIYKYAKDDDNLRVAYQDDNWVLYEVVGYE